MWGEFYNDTFKRGQKTPKDKDFLEINKVKNTDLELAPTKEMLKISLKHKPNYICIVPEKDQKSLQKEG